MTSTGKKARRQYGNRYSCKRAKEKKGRRKEFGHLPVSVAAGNAAEFVRKHTAKEQVEGWGI